jgi:endothelin-converting enzyme/putative endopeptidase
VVGRLYVDRRFAGDSKKIATEMIEDIMGAFESALPGLTWMDDATRKRALDKAQAVVDKIGYPDRWRDYSDLEIVAGDYFANAAAARRFAFEFEADKIGKPVDKKEWGMTPQMVNAYYNPLFNEIVFPAGILQPPFFERDFPAAMNYGAIGAVIGHELTHGFDDSGRKFAPDGQLREWWEPKVIDRFEERAQCVRDLYSSYQVEEGVNVQGDLTIGENIADIGGLKQAYAAYQRWEKRHGEPDLGIDLTPEQVLFVSFGQVWCSKASAEFERLQVTTDSHSPARFRVIGPVSNNPAFAEAFSCQAGAPMAPKERCEVW